MNNTKSVAATLREAYQRDAQGMLNAAWSFTWWQHGGEPGPDWLSDKVDLVAAAGRIQGQYTRARNAPTPPFQSQADQYVGAVPRELAAKLLKAIFEKKFFEETWPAEGRAALADAMHQTFGLTIGAVHVEKTLHEPTAAELGDLASVCAVLSASLRETGLHRDVTPNVTPK